MHIHTDVVQYRWTNFDRLAASPWVPLPNLHLTPYRIPVRDVTFARDWDVGQLVDISLGLTHDAATVARFFREGYEWVDMPEEVEPGATLGELFGALFAHDPRKFAHLDPVLNVASTAGDVIASAPAASLGTVLDPELLPFADLALLHFEYWGNTDLRAAVINEMSTSFEIPLLEIDPLSVLMTALLPLAIPTSQGDSKVEKVLARRPVRGVPIRAVPTSGPSADGKRVKVVSPQPPRIELDRFSRQVLWPLRYREWEPRASKVRFRVTVPVPAARTRIEILRGGSVYYAEEHDYGQFIVPGTHIWTWDGYDEHGVFDTSILKNNDLSARLTVRDIRGRSTVAMTHLGSSPDRIRWVDAKIIEPQRRIEVTVACRFTQPSAVEIASFRIPLGPLGGALSSAVSGLSSLATGAVGGVGGSALGMIPGISMIPGADSDNPSIPYPGLPGASSIAPAINTGEVEAAVNLPPVFDLDDERFATLQTAVMTGIARHWSRTVTIEGQEWTIDVKTTLGNGADAVWTILARAFGESFGDPSIEFGSRSFNLATFMEGLPVVNLWEEGDSDEGRARVGAHELGHSVLRESHSFYWSLIHKGSSTIGQDPNDAAPDLLGLAAGSEIDLMLYPSGGRPGDWQERTFAAEEDALALVAMAALAVG